MRITRTVAFFLLFVLPCVAYAQQVKSATPTSQTMEGMVIGTDGTKYWSGFKIESGGKEYRFVTKYNVGQGTNPTVTGGKCCVVGTRVSVTYTGSLTRYLLNVTHIVIHGAASGAQFMPPDGGVTQVPAPVRTPQDGSAARITSQTATKELGEYRYLPDEKPDGKIHNPLEQRPQMIGTITLTNVGITLSGEQPSGNSQPERCNFIDSPAGTIGRSNTKIRTSWSDYRDQYSVDGYRCRLLFETQQERDRFFADFTRTFQEWKTKYAGFQFAAGKLSIIWPCTRGQEAAPCADIASSNEKPVWRSETYKVTVESLEKTANSYVASLVFENLTAKTIELGWEEKSSLLDAAGPYLINEKGEKYFAQGSDSEKIIRTSFVMGAQSTEIPPMAKLASRFVFSGSGDGKIFNLEAKGIEWPVGKPITIEGLKVTSASVIKPDLPKSVNAAGSPVGPPLSVSVLSNPESIVTDAFNAYRKGNSSAVSTLMSEQGMSNSDIYCQGAAMNCLNSNYAGAGELKTVKTRLLNMTDSAAEIVLQTTWSLSGGESRRCQTYQLDMTNDGWRIKFFDVPQPCSE